MPDISTYQISLPQFEGPFDLLLFFIKRDELDIQDIPIHKIANDFLNYIHSLEQMNIEIAGEFILVAATLMKIKAKMLIPRKELNAEGEEIDPRQELVQKLLEYKQYKSVLETLQKMELESSRLVSRGNILNENKQLLHLYAGEEKLEKVSLFKLYKSFHDVLDKLKDRKNKVEHKVIPYIYTIEKEKENLVAFMSKKPVRQFHEIFDMCKTKIHAVFIFLAMLELIQQQFFSIEIGEGYNNIWLKA